MMFSILAQSLPKKASVQGIGTFIVLLLTLFGGFIVNPTSYVVSQTLCVKSLYSDLTCFCASNTTYAVSLRSTFGSIGRVPWRGRYKV
jgi:hypothetical protein